MPQQPMTVYKVIMTGVLETEADSTQDAIDKTIAYFAGHLDQLNYNISTHIVMVDTPEGP